MGLRSSLGLALALWLSAGAEAGTYRHPVCHDRPSKLGYIDAFVNQVTEALVAGLIDTKTARWYSGEMKHQIARVNSGATDNDVNDPCAYIDVLYNGSAWNPRNQKH